MRRANHRDVASLVESLLKLAFMLVAIVVLPIIGCGYGAYRMFKWSNDDTHDASSRARLAAKVSAVALVVACVMAVGWIANELDTSTDGTVTSVDQTSTEVTGIQPYPLSPRCREALVGFRSSFGNANKFFWGLQWQDAACPGDVDQYAG